jgi:hypothetical protein
MFVGAATEIDITYHKSNGRKKTFHVRLRELGTEPHIIDRLLSRKGILARGYAWRPFTRLILKAGRKEGYKAG